MYNAVSLLTVLQNLVLTLLEGQEPRIFENRVLKRMLRCNEVTGTGRRLSNRVLKAVFLPTLMKM